MNKRLSGVTLIEVLIIAAILALLGTLSFAGWRVQVAKGRDAKRKEDLQILRTALIAYHTDKNCYPDADAVICGSKMLYPYLEEVPCDPVNSATKYYYYYPEGCKRFTIFTKLENTKDPIITRVGCQFGCGTEYRIGFNYFVTDGDVQFVDVDEGLPPECGSITKSCFANECGSCCPGANYRCNSEGNWCFKDESCN